MEKEYYSTGEVARMLGVSNFAVWNWIQKGKIKAIRTPGGHYRIPADEVRKLLHGGNE